jgi:hypothetical protein
MHVARIRVGAILSLERDEAVPFGGRPEAANERPSAELAVVAVHDAVLGVANVRARLEAVHGCDPFKPVAASVSQKAQVCHGSADRVSRRETSPIAPSASLARP